VAFGQRIVLAAHTPPSLASTPRIFAPRLTPIRAWRLPTCHAEGRGFESHQPLSEADA
jgi:hypothetical protein